MPRATETAAPDDPTQDDPRDIVALERMRAKPARHNREAEQLAEAMRLKQKKN